MQWLYYRPFPGKFATISENRYKKHFSEFVEDRNSELLARNVKEKGVVLHKDLFEIFEISEHSFFSKHLQKSICIGVSSTICCRL